ncbi:unnamed protein product [Lactuca saligna]|uniref:Cyclin-dependent kinase inhibitor n=1 Tax=Lactuca saligna TaxID=75948 RepID=A0AA35Z9D5_LACSI|nr:unnamed protein product [Lactuca saligna]
MGRYMRKANLTGDVVAVMDVSQSSLGVRTRAKTLALQKLRATKSTATPPESPAVEQDSELSYLQLRSRRLEKPPFQQLTCCRQQNPNPNLLTISSGVSGSVGSGSLDTQIKAGEETEESCHFGENNIDFDGRERSTRESTPCSLIKDIYDIYTPGSSTRSMNLEASRISQNSMPLAQEIEEFFTRHDQEQQRRFADKYNFDIVNEKPLGGRYEWVQVQSQ